MVAGLGNRLDLSMSLCPPHDMVKNINNTYICNTMLNTPPASYTSGPSESLFKVYLFFKNPVPYPSCSSRPEVLTRGHLTEITQLTTIPPPVPEPHFHIRTHLINNIKTIINTITILFDQSKNKITKTYSLNQEQQTKNQKLYNSLKTKHNNEKSNKKYSIKKYKNFKFKNENS